MTLLIFAAIAGIGVGLLSGLLGVGGGTIMVPLFRLVFGMSPVGATATSLFTIIPTSLSGVTKHLKNRTCLAKVGLLAGIGGALLSPIGVLAANASPGWMVMAAAALVIIYSSYTMFRKAMKAPKPEKGFLSKRPGPAPAAPDASTAPAATPAPATPATDVIPTVTLLIALKAAGIGVLAGFMSGYVGVGGGFLMVPMFVSLLGIPMRLASGTSLIAVCILAIPGALTQCVLSNVDFLVGIAMAVGTIPGARWGAGLVKKVPERTLRLIFAGFLLVMAVVLIGNELLLA